MKKKEELNAPKEEVETVSRKLHDLTDEELAQVSGGFGSDSPDFNGKFDLEPPVIEVSIRK